MLGVFAEFERSMIDAERVKAGLKRARAGGKLLGRPRVSASVEAKVVALREQGRGMRAIGRELGIAKGPLSGSVVYKYEFVPVKMEDGPLPHCTIVHDGILLSTIEGVLRG